MGIDGCDSVREERQGFWLGIDGCDREERQGFWLGIDGCDSVREERV